jgi:hypothetical protein
MISKWTEIHFMCDICDFCNITGPDRYSGKTEMFQTFNMTKSKAINRAPQFGWKIG